MAQRWALPPDVNREKATNDAIAYSCKKIGHFHIAYSVHNRFLKIRFFIVFCVPIFDIPTLPSVTIVTHSDASFRHPYYASLAALASLHFASIQLHLIYLTTIGISFVAVYSRTPRDIKLTDYVMVIEFSWLSVFTKS